MNKEACSRVQVAEAGFELRILGYEFYAPTSNPNLISGSYGLLEKNNNYFFVFFFW